MSQTVLLCGGPDRCGKTTILSEVSRRIGVPVFKPSNMHENFTSRQDKFIQELRHADFRMLDLIRQTRLSVLVDRAYMCEWVYSRFFTRDTDMRMLRKLDDAFAEMGAKLLICTRSSFKGIRDDLNPNLDEEALTRLAHLYRQFTFWTSCEYKVLHVDDENLDRQAGEVLHFINRPKEDAK